MIVFKKIEGEVLTSVTDTVQYIKTIDGDIQDGDFINLSGFIGFLQNLDNTEETLSLVNPKVFGLQNKYNKKMITIEINY